MTQTFAEQLRELSQPEVAPEPGSDLADRLRTLSSQPTFADELRAASAAQPTVETKPAAPPTERVAPPPPDVAPPGPITEVPWTHLSVSHFPPWRGMSQEELQRGYGGIFRGGEAYFLENVDSVEVPPREQWPQLKRKKGKIGLRERVQDIRWRESTPVLAGFYRGARAQLLRESVELLKEEAEGKRALHPRERHIRQEALRKFGEEIEYYKYRGVTIPAWASQVSAQALPWMGEFVMTAGAAGPVGAAAKGAAAKVLGKRAASLAGRAALGATGLVARAATREVLLPANVWARAEEFQLAGDDSRRAWGKAALAMLIEYATEETGGTLVAGLRRGAGWAGKGLGKMGVGGRVGAKIGAFLRKAWVGSGQKPSRLQAMLKVGQYHGIVGELGEERLAGLLHALAQTEDFGFTPEENTLFKRIRAGVLPPPEQWAAEALGFLPFSAPRAGAMLGTMISPEQMGPPAAPAEAPQAEAVEPELDPLLQAYLDAESVPAEAATAEVAAPEVPQGVIPALDWHKAARTGYVTATPTAEFWDWYNRVGPQGANQAGLSVWKAGSGAWLVSKKVSTEGLPLEQWSWGDLKAEAQRRGIKIRGGREALVPAIRAAQEAPQPEATEEQQMAALDAAIDEGLARVRAEGRPLSQEDMDVLAGAWEESLPAEGETEIEAEARQTLDRIETDPEFRYAGFDPVPITRDILGKVGASLEKGLQLRRHAPEAYEAVRRITTSEPRAMQEAIRKELTDLFGHVPREIDQGPLADAAEDTTLPAPAGYEKEVRIMRGFYDSLGRQMKSRNLLSLWPGTAIAANEQSLVDLRQEIEELPPLPADATPQQRAGRTRSIRVRQGKMDRLTGANERLAELRYVRHSVKDKPSMWPRLARWGKSLVRSDRLSPKPTRLMGRRVPTLAELRELGIPHEPSATAALGEYMAYTLQKIAIHDFHERFKAQETNLVKPLKDSKTGEDLPVPDGWMDISDRLSEYRGYVVHPYLAQAFGDFTEIARGQGIAIPIYDHINVMGKLLKFHKFQIMAMYNALQGFARAGIRPALNLPKAAQHVWTRSAEYKEYLAGDAFPQPPDLGFAEHLKLLKIGLETSGLKHWRLNRWIMRHAEATSPREAWLSILNPTHMNLYFRLNRKMTWWLDRVFRLATGLALEKKGIPRHVAIVKARNAHADYGFLRAKPGAVARRVLLTPRFQAAMWRLFGQIGGGIVRGKQTQFGMTRPEAVAYAARAGLTLLGVAAVAALRGYAWMQGYRLLRREKLEDEETGREEEIERVTLLFGPFAEPLKMWQRYKEGGLLQVIQNKFAAVPGFAIRALRNKDWKSEPIYDAKDSLAQQKLDFAAWAVREVVPLVEEVGDWFDPEYETVDNLLRLVGVLRYRRTPTSRWYRWRLLNEAKELRAWARRKTRANPSMGRYYARRAGERWQEYERSATEELARHEARLRAVKNAEGVNKVLRSVAPWLFTAKEPKTGRRAK